MQWRDIFDHESVKFLFDSEEMHSEIIHAGRA